MSPFAFLMFGLVFVGLGGWMLLTSSGLFLLVFGVLFLLVGVGQLLGCVWLRRSGVGWLQTRF